MCVVGTLHDLSTIDGNVYSTNCKQFIVVDDNVFLFYFVKNVPQWKIVFE